jgi:hypothetical protein
MEWSTPPISAEELVMKTDMELRQDVEKELAWNPKVDASDITVTALTAL